MSTILITGGTGLIGTALTRLLTERGYRVIVLSRKKDGSSPAGAPSPARTNIPTQARWDPDTGYIDPAAIQSADYIIHLAGAGVADHRWSAARKKSSSKAAQKPAPSSQRR
ncbi:NAD-dependent epimerase/dehydratase family protein [Puia sp. P3]|uniref:NAD-dependent epimerase/dehydratase family protein n=1 Tax=Puia sp. P3 TaxID=3423952 RepID=UPI003D679E68